MSVINALGAAVYSRLSTTSGLTSLLASGSAIYNTQAPDDAALPYVVFSLQGGGDDRESAHRTKNLLLFIRGYTGAGQAAAGTIDAQIDTALNMKPLTVSGWTNFWISREQDFARVEIDEANYKTWMAGAFYRVRLDNS